MVDLEAETAEAEAVFPAERDLASLEVEDEALIEEEAALIGVDLDVTIVAGREAAALIFRPQDWWVKARRTSQDSF